MKIRSTHFHSILVCSLAGLRGIIDHFSNVYSYEHVSLIINENFERFPERAKETMEKYPVGAIDKIIDSTDRRKTEIIKCKGESLKYQTNVLKRKFLLWIAKIETCLLN